MKRNGSPVPCRRAASPVPVPGKRAPSPQPPMSSRSRPPASPAITKGSCSIPPITPDSARKRLALQDCTNTQSDRHDKSQSMKDSPRNERKDTPEYMRHDSSSILSQSPCAHTIPTTEVRFLLSAQDKVWAAEREGPITVRNGQSGEVEDILPVSGTNFCWCLLLVESTVWAGFSNGQIRVYSAETHTLLKELHQHAGGVYCLASSNGHVYSGSNDFECFRWHAKRYEFIRQYSGHKNSVRCILAFSSNLITGSDDHTIRLWDILTGDVKCELLGHRGGVLALLHDGTRLWSSSEDGTIRIWNWETGQHLQTISGHTGRVTCLKKLGYKVFSTGVDRSICCYHAETFRQLGKYLEHEGYINHFIPIGHVVQYWAWSCSSDKTIRVWNFETNMQYVTEEAAPIADDATPLNQAMEQQCLQLQERLQETNAAHAKALELRDETVKELETKIAELQQDIRHRDELSQNLESQLNRERANVEQCHKEVGGMRSLIGEAEAVMQQWKTEWAVLEEKYKQQLQQKQMELDERDNIILELQQKLKNNEQESHELRLLVKQKDAIQADLQNHFKALKAHIETSNKANAELQSQNDKLRSELTQKASELNVALNAENNARRDAAFISGKITEMGNAVAMERQKNDSLQRELADANQRIKQLQCKVQSLEDQLRQHEVLSQAALQNAVELEGRMKELEAEKHQFMKKETEFEFVLQSRSELVRQIWELFCDIGDAKKAYRELLLCPALKQFSNPKDQQRAEKVLKILTGAKERNKRIVCNYFTEIEKFHVGTSPYFFPPDEDVGRYRVLESNLEAVRRLGMHDLRNTATLGAVREKSTASRRSSSMPACQPTYVGELAGNETPEITSALEGRPKVARPNQSTPQVRAASPPPKPRSAERYHTPIRDKTGSRSRSPRL